MANALQISTSSRGVSCCVCSRAESWLSRWFNTPKVSRSNLDGNTFCFLLPQHICSCCSCCWPVFLLGGCGRQPPLSMTCSRLSYCLPFSLTHGQPQRPMASAGTRQSPPASASRPPWQSSLALGHPHQPNQHPIHSNSASPGRPAHQPCAVLITLVRTAATCITHDCRFRLID